MGVGGWGLGGCPEEEITLYIKVSCVLHCLLRHTVS